MSARPRLFTTPSKSRPSDSDRSLLVDRDPRPDDERPGERSADRVERAAEPPRGPSSRQPIRSESAVMAELDEPGPEEVD